MSDADDIVGVGLAGVANIAASIGCGGVGTVGFILQTGGGGGGGGAQNPPGQTMLTLNGNALTLGGNSITLTF